MEQRYKGQSQNLDKRQQIAGALEQLFQEQRMRYISTTKIGELADDLSRQTHATPESVRSFLYQRVVVQSKEAIDFSDAGYWIDLISDIINQKR